MLVVSLVPENTCAWVALGLASLVPADAFADVPNHRANVVSGAAAVAALVDLAVAAALAIYA